MKSKLLTMITLALLTIGLTITTSQEAFAGVGSTIKSSKKKGKRSHKLQKRAKKSPKTKKSAKSTTKRKVSTRKVSNSPRTVRRTTTTRRVSGHSSGRRVVKTRTTRHSHRSHTRRHVRTTHHHHHHHRSHGHTTHHSARKTNAPARRSTIEPYVRGGLGISALAAPQLTDDALPGVGYDVAIGAKGKWLGAELSLNGGAFSLDENSDQNEITTIGLSLDFKAQPKIGVFEPFAMIGIGGYYLGDKVLDEAAGAGALRLGFGADLRFDNIALGARYTWAAYEFSNDQSYVEGVSANTETIGVNLAFYF